LSVPADRTGRDMNQHNTGFHRSRFFLLSILMR
jgi:hypothetical protein